MGWDRSKPSSRKRGTAMRKVDHSPPQQWACSSLSSSDKFSSLYDKMLEGTVDLDKKNAESLVCTQYPEQVTILPSIPRPRSKIVFPFLVTRGSVVGNKVYCKTSIDNSFTWHRKNGTPGAADGCLMFENFYHQGFSDVRPGIVQVHNRTTPTESDQSNSQMLDLLGTGQCRTLLLSVAGAAGMKVICPGLRVPLLEILLFTHQQWPPRKRAMYNRGGGWWRFPLNLALAISRPFYGSLLRRSLTALLFMLQMRVKKKLQHRALTYMPDLYSVVLPDKERTSENQVTHCSKFHLVDDSIVKDAGDFGDNLSWPGSRTTFTDERKESVEKLCNKSSLETSITDGTDERIAPLEQDFTSKDGRSDSSFADLELDDCKPCLKNFARQASYQSAECGSGAVAEVHVDNVAGVGDSGFRSVLTTKDASLPPEVSFLPEAPFHVVLTDLLSDFREENSKEMLEDTCSLEGMDNGQSQNCLDRPFTVDAIGAARASVEHSEFPCTDSTGYLCGTDDLEEKLSGVMIPDRDFAPRTLNGLPSLDGKDILVEFDVEKDEAVDLSPNMFRGSYFSDTECTESSECLEVGVSSYVELSVTVQPSEGSIRRESQTPVDEIEIYVASTATNSCDFPSLDGLRNCEDVPVVALPDNPPECRLTEVARDSQETIVEANHFTVRIDTDADLSLDCAREREVMPSVGECSSERVSVFQLAGADLESSSLQDATSDEYPSSDRLRPREVEDASPIFTREHDCGESLIVGEVAASGRENMIPPENDKQSAADLSELALLHSEVQLVCMSNAVTSQASTDISLSRRLNETLAAESHSQDRDCLAADLSLENDGDVQEDEEITRGDNVLGHLIETDDLVTTENNESPSSYEENDSGIEATAKSHLEKGDLEDTCVESSDASTSHPFADHPTCISLRKLRHSHGDQTYLAMPELLLAPWGNLIYWHGHCKEGRPTLCVQLGKAVRQLSSSDLKHFTAVTVSHLEYAELNFFKGSVKQMNILMDLEGIGFMRLPPMHILQSIGTILNRDYAGRGGWIILVNAPMMLGLVISAIQRVILRPSYTKGAVIDKGFLEGKERIMTLGGRYRSTLLNHFDESLLPSALGGKCTCNFREMGMNHCDFGVSFLSL